jgi:hypothetical protein
VKVLSILQMEMQLMKEKEQLMVAETGLSVTTLQMAIMSKMWAGK